MKTSLQICLFFVGLTLVGCASQASTVKDRASYDLECDEELEIQEIGGNTYGVRGCDRKATYVCNRAHPITCVLESIDGSKPKN